VEAHQTSDQHKDAGTKLGMALWRVVKWTISSEHSQGHFGWV
jgi:hypothetical protein